MPVPLLSLRSKVKWCTVTGKGNHKLKDFQGEIATCDLGEFKAMSVAWVLVLSLPLTQRRTSLAKSRSLCCRVVPFFHTCKYVWFCSFTTFFRNLHATESFWSVLNMKVRQFWRFTVPVYVTTSHWLARRVVIFPTVFSSISAIMPSAANELWNYE